MPSLAMNQSQGFLKRLLASRGGLQGVKRSMRCERVSSLGGQLATRSGAGIAGQSDTKLRWMRRLVFSSRVAVVVDEKARTRRAWSGGAASNKCRSNRSC